MGHLIAYEFTCGHVSKNYTYYGRNKRCPKGCKTPMAALIKQCEDCGGRMHVRPTQHNKQYCKPCKLSRRKARHAASVVRQRERRQAQRAARPTISTQKTGPTPKTRQKRKALPTWEPPNRHEMAVLAATYNHYVEGWNMDAYEALIGKPIVMRDGARRVSGLIIVASAAEHCCWVQWADDNIGLFTTRVNLDSPWIINRAALGLAAPNTVEPIRARPRGASNGQSLPSIPAAPTGKVAPAGKSQVANGGSTQPATST